MTNLQPFEAQDSEYRDAAGNEAAVRANNGNALPFQVWLLVSTILDEDAADASSVSAYASRELAVANLEAELVSEFEDDVAQDAEYAAEKGHEPSYDADDLPNRKKEVAEFCKALFETGSAYDAGHHVGFRLEQAPLWGSAV